MITRPTSPCSAIRRRALARISRSEMPGVSSMKMGASDRRPAPVVSFGQSASERYPVRSLCESTLETEQSMRCTSCSLDISRLKMATGMRSWMEACSATCRQKLGRHLVELPEPRGHPGDVALPIAEPLDELERPLEDALHRDEGSADLV